MFVDYLKQLDVDGTSQRARVCAARPGLPPLLVVQAGPGFPLLHEVPRFRRRLALEDHFTVYYWEQRGCGPAKRRDAESVSLARQLDDLHAWVRQIRQETFKDVTVLAISMGATAALMAAARDAKGIHAIVAISPDLKFPDIDLYLASYLSRRATPGQKSKLAKLGPPPYLEPARFQLRAQLLAEVGAVEHGRGSLSLLGETLLGLVRTYGLLDAFRSLRNMSIVQGRMLPELLELDLFPSLPKLACPVHYIVSPEDPFVPPDIREKLAALVAKTRQAMTVVKGARHMVHFDKPEAVRLALEDFA